MKFNFKKYIKENYLNESITSNIFIDKLLNDTGGMFKYYISSHSKTFLKLANIKEDMLKMFSTLSSLSGDSSKYDTRYIAYKNELIKSDEQVKALYNKYLKNLQNYIKCIKNIFVKPDPLLFKDMLNNFNYYQTPIDLFNINDSNFKFFKYADIKNDLGLKNELINILNNHLAFFISEDDKIQAAVLYNKILLLSIESQYNNLTIFKDKLPQEFFKSLCSNDLIQNNCLKIRLKDDTVLNVPILKELLIDNIKNYYSSDNNDKVISTGFIHEYLLCNSINKYIPINKKLKIGKFFSKSSPLQKNTDWGKSLNDYIIVYTAEQPFSDELSLYTSKINRGSTFINANNTLGYNDILINATYNELLDEHKKDVKKYVNTTYQWIKTLLGKYIPYGGINKDKLWSYGHKLTEIEIMNLYKGDKTNSDMAYNNIVRYKDILEQTKTIRNLGNYKEQITPYLAKINSFVFKGKQLITKIKNFYNTDIAKVCSLSLLYKTYNTTLNLLIYNYSKSLNDITIFHNNYSVANIVKMKKEGRTSTSITDDLKKFKNNINNALNELNNYIQTIEILDNKIDELLNE